MELQTLKEKVAIANVRACLDQTGVIITLEEAMVYTQGISKEDLIVEYNHLKQQGYVK